MTLLVLPLIELIPEAGRGGVGELITKNFGPFFAFALSFTVIYQFWTAHDQLYAAYPTGDMHGVSTLHGIWLLAIAFLPFPTALLGRTTTGGTVPLYLGTMLVISLSGALIAISVIRRHDAELSTIPRAAFQDRVRATWLTTGVFTLCFAVSWWLPDAGLYGLLLLIPAGPLAARARRTG